MSSRSGQSDRGDKYARFANITFEDFRKFAVDPSLSQYEKVGFPDEYRKGFGPAIFADIRSKLPALDGENKRIADIGPGCSELPAMLIGVCRERGHGLTLIDSREMLEQLMDAPFIEKLAAEFPNACDAFIERNAGSFDAVLAYSVLHYVIPGGDGFGFVDAGLTLLAPGGVLLIGDIPNVSKRKRFFASESGVRFHQAFTGSAEPPAVHFNVATPGQIDDAVVLGILMRARAAGFDAYVAPQASGLPMANRREDILIARP